MATEVRFFVNGERVKTGDEGARTNASRLELRLRPGQYTVEATYRGYALDGVRSGRVLTRGPVEVRAGRTTWLVADVTTSWGGVNDEPVAYFRLASSGPRPSPPASAPSAAMPSASAADGARYSTAHVPMHVATLPAEVADEPGYRLPPGRTRLLEPSDPLLPEPSPGAARTPQSLEHRRGPQGVLSIRTLPPGARVLLDDRDVGVTPLRVRVDAATDHVLRFQLDTCEPRLQMLTAADWESGSSASILVRLDCR
jgi:hypothetical protein